MIEDPTLYTLIGMAGLLGFFHTLTGPDHYIPFIAMSRVGGWSPRRTTLITLACGLGHVLSSILLGMLGIALGMALSGLTWFETSRGEIAGWLLLGFGLAYMVWGFVQAIRNRPHAHVHGHEDGTIHLHPHRHQRGHLHVHAKQDREASMTPWILFAIFVFGPCEPLIPILMYPAATVSVWGVVTVAAVFGVTTLVTMLGIVLATQFGLSGLSLPWLNRYSHALAGGAIALCGVAVTLGF